VSPKCELDDPASEFFAPRPVELTVALYFVPFLGHFEERAVNIVTLYGLKEREMISATVRIFFFSPKLPDGLWKPPRLPFNTYLYISLQE
jgi:hypothetical protein